MTADLMVVLPEDDVRAGATYDGRNLWFAAACAAALARPVLPDGVPQVGWSMDGYPMVNGADIPEGWERRHDVATSGEWRLRHNPVGTIYAVRPVPPLATERVPWWEAVGRRLPDGGKIGAVGLNSEHPNGWFVAGTTFPAVDADADGTVEVLVEGSAS